MRISFEYNVKSTTGTNYLVKKIIVYYLERYEVVHG